jgi:hypothetical protein
MDEMIIHEKQVRTWKEAVVPYFEVLSRYNSRMTDENHEDPQSGKLGPGPRFEPGISWIQVYSVTVTLTCSVPE